jgi:hypothetical protein
MSDSPYASPSYCPPPPTGGAFDNFGNYFTWGFRAYSQTWQAWIVPMLLAALILLGGLVCCYVGLFIVAGPLACGLFTCALRALRGQPVDNSGLGRGWDRLGPAILGWLVPQLLVMVPAMLIVFGPMFLFALLGPVLAPHHGGRGGGPNDAAVVLLMLGMWAVMLIGGFGMIVWAFWISTRTMFILPLIADRDIDFGEAWRTSWEATRHGFWELLLLNFLAGMIAGLGAYVCYVGLIFTLPIYYCLLAAAYEHRCAPPAAVPEVGLTVGHAPAEG